MVAPFEIRSGWRRRARILLVAGQRMSEAAAALHSAGVTVEKWRERFRQFRLEGLSDEPRVGAPIPWNRRQQCALEHSGDGGRDGSAAER